MIDLMIWVQSEQKMKGVKFEGWSPYSSFSRARQHALATCKSRANLVVLSSAHHHPRGTRKKFGPISQRSGIAGVAGFACHPVRLTGRLFWSTTFAILWLERPGKLLENFEHQPAWSVPERIAAWKRVQSTAAQTASRAKIRRIPTVTRTRPTVTRSRPSPTMTRPTPTLKTDPLPHSVAPRTE